MINLQGTGAIIVGTRRIGAVIAHQMAQEGIKIVVVYRNSKAEANKLVTQLKSKTDLAVAIKCDLSDENQVKKMINQAKSDLGTLNFGINLASSFPRNPFKDLDAKAWDISIEDAKGTFLFGIHAGSAMMANAGPTKGHLIFFSDWAAIHAPYKNYLPYMSAKAAIDFMTRAFAVELASSGILVNAIAPGPTMRPTDIAEPSWNENVVAKSPLVRESSANDMAKMIVALLKTDTITGETIRIDSGRHLAGPGN